MLYHYRAIRVLALHILFVYSHSVSIVSQLHVKPVTLLLQLTACTISPVTMPSAVSRTPVTPKRSRGQPQRIKHEPETPRDQPSNDTQATNGFSDDHSAYSIPTRHGRSDARKFSQIQVLVVLGCMLTQVSNSKRTDWRSRASS